MSSVSHFWSPKSPHLLVMLRRTLFSCEAPAKFCWLWKLFIILFKMAWVSVDDDWTFIFTWTYPWTDRLQQLVGSATALRAPNSQHGVSLLLYLMDMSVYKMSERSTFLICCALNCTCNSIFGYMLAGLRDSDDAPAGVFPAIAKKNKRNVLQRPCSRICFL